MEDNGPGISDENKEAVFRDFTGQIPPGRISSILDLGFALQRRS